MSDLPKGWVERPLAEFCEVVRGGSPRPIKSYITNDPSAVNWIKIGDAPVGGKFISETEERIIPEGVSRSRFVREGDFILSNSMSFGRPYIMKTTGCVHDGWLVLSPDYSVVDQDFLYLVLGSPVVFRQLDDMAAGVTVRNLNIGLVKKTKIPLPPLAEQRRIVEKLDSLTAQSREAANALTRLETLIARAKQAVLAAAFRGELTTDWRLQNRPLKNAGAEVLVAEAKKSGKLRIKGKRAAIAELKLAELPESWSWIPNHHLAEDNSNAICAGPFGTIFKAKDFRDIGVPIIFLRHVGPGEYKTKKPGFMDPEVWKNLHQPYSVHGGELLVTKLGEPPGVACIYPEGIGTGMVTPDVMKMNVDQSVASSKYLMHFFNSPMALEVLKGLAFGMTRLRIDLTLFKSFPVPLASFAEQAEIVARIEAAFAQIETLARAVTAARARLASLDRAILAKAFRGDLVHKDPNGEPASELLDRVRVSIA